MKMIDNITRVMLNGRAKKLAIYILIAWLFLGFISLISVYYFYEKIFVISDEYDSISDSFLVSFLASLFEDIIFFGTIGVAVLIITSRKPHDETIGQRLHYLYSGRGVTDGSLNYTRHQIDKFAVFTSSARIDLYITAFNESLNSYRIESKNHQTLTNMYKNRPYIDNNVPVQIFIDPIETDDPKAELLLHRVTTKDDIFDLINFPVKVFNDYQISASISIPPDETALLDTNFWLWSKIGHPYLINVIRYSENFSISMHNHCDKKVFYKTDIDDHQTFDLLPGATVDFLKEAVLEPERKIIFFLVE